MWLSFRTNGQWFIDEIYNNRSYILNFCFSTKKHWYFKLVVIDVSNINSIQNSQIWGDNFFWWHAISPGQGPLDPLLGSKPLMHNPTHLNHLSGYPRELLVGIELGCLGLQFIPSLQPLGHTLTGMGEYLTFLFFLPQSRFSLWN